MLAAGIVVLAAAIFVCRAAAYTGILPNTFVERTKVGGMNKDEAASVLYGKYEAELGETVTLRCGDNEKQYTFSELGLTVDTEKTAEAAYNRGREHGIFSKTISYIGSLFSHYGIEPCFVSDSEMLDAAVSELAAPYETAVKELSYSLSGTELTVNKGEGGVMVDRAKVLEQIEKAVGSETTKTVELIPEAAEPGKKDLDELYAELTKPAQNAYYTRVDGEVTVADDVPQMSVDKKELEKFLNSDEKTAVFAVGITPAEKTAAELKKMMFRDVMGSYSSSYATSTSGRAANVELAASRINGCVLLPGEVFSYDGTIGRRTAANGYHEAGVYIGNKVEQGIGGGICQTSSTLYSAALYANLEIVQRTSHSLPVSYVPAGQDATIAEGYIDLKIKNNTEYPIKISAVWGGRRLTCKILGVKPAGQSVEIINTKTGTKEPKVTREYDDTIPVGYKKISQKGAAGYTVASKRIVRVNGQIVKEEKLKGSVYNASDTIELINPADKDTSSEELKVYVKNTQNTGASVPVSGTAASPSETGGGETLEQTPQQTVPDNENSEAAENPGGGSETGQETENTGDETVDKAETGEAAEEPETLYID